MCVCLHLSLICNERCIRAPPPHPSHQLACGVRKQGFIKVNCSMMSNSLSARARAQTTDIICVCLCGICICAVSPGTLKLYGARWRGIGAHCTWHVGCRWRQIRRHSEFNKRMNRRQQQQHCCYCYSSIVQRPHPRIFV